jgi:NAD(P)-dependent dehydrogenase (short-subunit alcohol dehydrogenase family)
MARKIWFITGISRGFGKALAQAVLVRGDVVIGTTRDGAAGLDAGAGTLHVLPLEVTDKAAIASTVERAFALHGRVDVLVNNAGYGLLGAIEESSEEETRRVFDVNFFGPLELIKAVLPRLRAQGRGHIINVSSIAGLAPMAGSGLYAASKFALEGMSQALAQELAPLGIRVTLVEPGAFRTDFLSAHSIRKTGTALEAYAATSGKAVRYLAQLEGRQPGDPERGARAILQAVDAETPPLHLVLGSDALQRSRAQVALMSRELDTWEAVTRSTDFPSGA